jgi:lipopolysaccharide/colanic/teichoic acid biosynthesis glycosyltransferase
MELQHTGSKRPSALFIQPADGIYSKIKRAFDMLASATLLVLLLPLFALIALCIRLDSEGPIFFRQTRVSRDSRARQRRRGRSPSGGGSSERRAARDRRLQNIGGRPFTIFKFRTMVYNCDSDAHRRYMEGFIRNDPADGNGTEPSKDRIFKLGQDTRVTRVGRILRKLSLDELPQLFNVLKGEMSLIGPRPELPYAVLLYQEWHRRRLRVLPGITGWWQVKGRSMVTFEEAVQMDIYYAEHCSLLLDLKILLLTPWAVISGRGAR